MPLATPSASASATSSTASSAAGALRSASKLPPGRYSRTTPRASNSGQSKTPKKVTMFGWSTRRSAATSRSKSDRHCFGVIVTPMPAAFCFASSKTSFTATSCEPL